MMAEFWWKIFLVSLASVGLAKLLGSSLGVGVLFAIAWIGWTVVLMGLVQLDVWWSKPGKGRKED